MGFKEILAKLVGKSKDPHLEKEYAEQQHAIESFENKRKSANERELERFIKEEREVAIKEQLEHFRKKRQIDNASHKILETPNMFRGSKSILLKKAAMMKNDKKLLKGGNLFYGR